MKKIKKYNYLLFVFFIALISIPLLIKYYKCPLRLITGIPCPLCGMTRAILSALKLNFKDAFYYHALWPIAVILIPTYLILKIKRIKINKKLENTLCIIIGILLITYYIIRHYYNSPIVRIDYYNSIIYNIYKNIIR